METKTRECGCMYEVDEGGWVVGEALILCREHEDEREGFARPARRTWMMFELVECEDILRSLYRSKVIGFNDDGSVWVHGGYPDLPASSRWHRGERYAHADSAFANSLRSALGPVLRAGRNAHYPQTPGMPPSEARAEPSPQAALADE